MSERTTAGPERAQHGTGLYRAHLVAGLLGLAAFLGALLRPDQIEVLLGAAGAFALLSGAAAIVGGRAVGTLTGHLLHRAHRDATPRERQRVARTYARSLGAWFVLVGAGMLAFAIARIHGSM